MSSDYRLTGYRRRIARRIVSLTIPKYPELDQGIVDDVVDGLEVMIRNYPPLVRFGIGMMLLFVELSGPITLTGLLPFSFLSRESGTKRLEKLSDHRFSIVRNIPKFLKILVCLNAYCRQDVEAYLGADRRPWRVDRLRFRDQLVQLDEARDLPDVPTALGSYDLATPDSYLQPGIGSATVADDLNGGSP